MPKAVRSATTLRILLSLGMNQNRYHPALAYLLAAGSGCAALSHELLWTRRLIDLLGTSAESTARVFAGFFLGLALGAACAPPLVRRLNRPWRAVALAELGIALLAVPALTLPRWTGWLWPALGVDRLAQWPGHFAKLTVSFLIVAPPAVVMGLVLPLMAAGFLRGERSLGREGNWLYAANTAGGLVGLWLPLALTLPALGLAGAMIASMAINLVVAAGCLGMDRNGLTTPAPNSSHGRETAAASPPGRSQEWVGRSAPLMLIAFLSGAGVLAIEVLAVHVLSQVVTAGLFVPMAVLTVVIGLLAAGAGVAPGLLRRGGDSSRLMVKVLALVAVTTACVPLLFVRVTGQMQPVAPQPSVTGYIMSLLGITFATMGPAVLLASLVLPLVFAWSATAGGDAHGRRWGWLLAGNGVGGLLGAEAAQRGLLPALGPHEAFGVVAGVYALAGLSLAVGIQQRTGGRASPQAARPSRARAAARPSLALQKYVVWPGLAALLTVAIWGFGLRPLPQINPAYGVRVLEQRCGREGAVAVIEHPKYGQAILLNNEYILGSTVEAAEQRRQAYLPLVLHPNPRRVAFIGLATGITAGAALDDPAIEQVTAIELTQPVARAATTYFGDFNRNLANDPRAQVVLEDGRTYVAASPGSFDMIVADYFQPWRSGVGRLYSLEHFAAIRRALRPGGIFCQWLPMYQFTADEARVVGATMLQVYPRVWLFRSGLRTSAPGLALVGYTDGDLDWAMVEKRCAAVRDAERVADPLLRHLEGVALLYLGALDPKEDVGARINTLNSAWLELEAARHRVLATSEEDYLFAGRWLNLEREMAGRRARDPDLPAPIRAAADAGLRVVSWDFLYRARDPLAAVRRAQVIQSLPAAVREDAVQNPAAWPGPAEFWE